MLLYITKEALHKKTPQEITALLYEECYINLKKVTTEIKNKMKQKVSAYEQTAIYNY